MRQSNASGRNVSSVVLPVSCFASRRFAVSADSPYLESWRITQSRVVILGEAAMLSAQKLFMRKFGMNAVKDADNKQLALNIIHWLCPSKLDAKK